MKDISLSVPANIKTYSEFSNFIERTQEVGGTRGRAQISGPTTLCENSHPAEPSGPPGPHAFDRKLFKNNWPIPKIVKNSSIPMNFDESKWDRTPPMSPTFLDGPRRRSINPAKQPRIAIITP